MAVKSNLPLNSPSAHTPHDRDEGRSDTASTEPNRVIRNGIESKRKKQTRPRKKSKLYDGLQTLYG